MLRTHMNAIENQLITTSKIPANAGHSLHKGTPREAFIKEFLEGHLSSNVSIGTGEIIDASSKPREPRNQYDIVIYNRDFPKLDFAGGVNCFLIESVVATIEVKSLLDYAGINQSTKAAHNAKELTPSVSETFSSGWVPPKVLNYVVAYDGPGQMSTVHGWIEKSHTDNGIPFPSWTSETRGDTSGTALDGVFLLGKGIVTLDNNPVTIRTPSKRTEIHTIHDSSEENLLMLFLMLQASWKNIQGRWLDPVPYVNN